MPRFAQASHREWIAAPPDTVRRQFADLDHHIRRNVHPKLHFEVLRRDPLVSRYLQEVRLLGLRQRDVFERRLHADGSIEDRAVEGFNRGGSLRVRFQPRRHAGRDGTEVQIDVRLPLPPLVGALLRPLLQWQLGRELRSAARQDKHDIEDLGYPVAGVRPAAA